MTKSSFDDSMLSKIDTIDQRWKLCKAKSLKMRDMSKQSPVRVVQAHFSKILNILYNCSTDHSVLNTMIPNKLIDSE